MVVLSDVYDVGWHVYVDGGSLPAYCCGRWPCRPAATRIQFRYATSLRAGLALTAGAALLILGCLAGPAMVVGPLGRAGSPPGCGAAAAGDAA